MKHAIDAVLRSPATLLVIALATSHAEAAVTEFTDFARWQTAAGPHATIDFTGYPQFTIITTQYTSLGVTFTDGNDAILNDDPFAFPLDDSGLYGNLEDAIRFSFSTPRTSVGVHFPGDIRFNLYYQGGLVYDSSIFFNPVSPFAGLTSSTPFDSVVLFDPLDSFVYIDNLYFGVPGPGVLPLLAMAGLCPSGRRRRSECDK